MHNALPHHSLARRQPTNREGLPQNFHPTQMANSVARIVLRNGKSFPQLLCRPLVGPPFNVNVCNKDQLSLINPTQQLYLQRPVLGDGFNFVVGKDQEFLAEHWKSSVVVKARGNQGRRYANDEEEEEEEEDDDDDDDQFDSDEVEDSDDNEDEDEDR